MTGQRVTEDSPACGHGHPFPENVARDSRGWLYCRECNRIRVRQHRTSAEPDPTAVDRATVIAELDQQGLSSKAIADQLGCSRRTVHRARAQRRAAGDDWTWTDPEPDEAAVQRAAAGEPPADITPAERHAAIAQCDRWGLPARITAERVGCTRQTVYYARSKRAA